jgi:hypothetical protein
MNDKIPCIYINGLSNNKIFPKIFYFFWKKCNMNFFFSNINWLDNKSFKIKKNEIILLSKALIKERGKLIIIGVSAGASLATNIFNEIKENNVSLVLINGRIYSGDYKKRNTNSLYLRSKQNKKKSSISFYNEVKKSERVIDNFSKKVLSKIIVLTSYFDFTVPKKLSTIKNTKTIISPIFGHGLSIFYNLIILKHKILYFIYTIF